MEQSYFKTQNLTVGYNNVPLIRNINITCKKGEIITLIGPNGSGKSTILKSITRHLSLLNGVVYLDGKNMSQMQSHEVATKVSVVLTERIRPEMMTCAEVVESGRYPYTNHFGQITSEDAKIVRESLERVHALELADRDFSAISDGQRQRIMLARAICQQPDIIVLDEPTSFLDIRHKIDLLDILLEMSREKQITVIMSLHEIDLASKISDRVICVKGDEISCFGTVEEVFTDAIIQDLYGMEKGNYNVCFGSVELQKTQGLPQVFVVAGNGSGIPCYRSLQKLRIPFATGILFENDMDYQVALSLASRIFSSPGFERISPQRVAEALEVQKHCKAIIQCDCPIGDFNRENALLLQGGLPLFSTAEQAAAYLRKGQ